MSQKDEATIMISSLLITTAILGSGYWWFSHQSEEDLQQNLSKKPISPKNQPITSGDLLSPPPSPTDSGTFFPPTTVTPGTLIKIDGATSMVLLNQALKNGFEQQFPGTQVITGAKGSDNGLKALLKNDIDIAATSRPLTSDEKNQGLVALPMAKEAIAIVVSLQNPFRKGLTEAQVRDIFQGKITNWSALGRLPGKIHVVNRPSASDTRQIFKELVLNGENFGDSSHIITLSKDATTPILDALKRDGIGYASYAHVADQQTVRTVPINDQTPESVNYPYQRSLYYVYKQPPSDGVQAFLGYAASPSGQQLISND